MKTYIYTVAKNSDRRGYNRTISVYRIKHNFPSHVGTDNLIHTASYPGDASIVREIIKTSTGSPVGNAVLVEV